MASIPASRAAISALKIEQRVERDVKAGIPELDRSVHTESEESLRAYVTSEIIGRVHRERQAALDEQANLRGEVKIRQHYQELRDTGRIIGQRLGNTSELLRRQLERTATALSSARMDLEIFRNRNGLTRDAVYRESKLLHYSVIFFIVICETALNSFFLSKGSQLGLVGGFFQAFIISVVNLGLAAFMAFSLRNLFHVNLLHKSLSLVLFLAVTAMAAFFVLGVGHYREALETDPFAASGLAVTSLLQQPLSIRDFNSWIMVVVSAMAVMLLVAKFFVVDDRYPGYTAVTRRLRVLQAQWMAQCAAAFTELRGQADATRQEVSKREQQIRSEFIGFKASIERSDHVRREYEEDIVKAQGLLDELIRHYQSLAERISNRRAAYFGKLLQVELEKLPHLNTAGLEQHKADLSFFERLLEKLDNEYEGAMEAISERLEEINAEVAGLIRKIEDDHGLSGL
ncbi:hypothetical protein [Microbulbifer yueqingensis]|uniref:Transmembrane protein n=1 Tax=Microbulbifer yueqingensis TaxID=658219 RepID=A0A1G8X6U6_9GAMM|nr:hypothetical protein [Microbulbifer yueqingensis]SDJ86036.1 hypothetical protein SAMN05216212_0980 [Microbulbifer yueqingensis]